MPPALIAVGSFTLVVSFGFQDELGRLLSEDAQSGEEVLRLIDRVVKGPFAPSLVLDCAYLDTPNELFRYSKIKGLIVEWSVSQSKGPPG